MSETLEKIKLDEGWQKEVVENTINGLKRDRSTLVITPFEEIKTIVLTEVLKAYVNAPNKKICFLSKNYTSSGKIKKKFNHIGSQIQTNGDQVIFETKKTLFSEKHFEQIGSIGLFVIDEVVHLEKQQEEYITLIKERVKNEEARVLGITTGTSLSDRKGFGELFKPGNKIPVSEIIKYSNLKAFSIFCPRPIPNTSHNKDNTSSSTKNYIPRSISRVFDKWKEKAKDRKTIVFCSSVEQAESVCEFFNKEISTGIISSKLSKKDNLEVFKKFREGNLQVIVNISMLIEESWEYPPTSCIILLATNSCQSAKNKMISRGLLPNNTTKSYENTKGDSENCIVLDFGKQKKKVLPSDQSSNGEEPTKYCKECAEGNLPIATKECPFCRRVLVEKKDASNVDFNMVEVKTYSKHDFQHIDVLEDKTVFFTPGINCFSATVCIDSKWYAFGGLRPDGEGYPKLEYLSGGSTLRKSLMVADKWMCENAQNGQIMDWMKTNSKQEAATDNQIHKIHQIYKRIAQNKGSSKIVQKKEWIEGNSLSKSKASAIINYMYNYLHIYIDIAKINRELKNK